MAPHQHEGPLPVPVGGAVEVRHGLEAHAARGRLPLLHVGPRRLEPLPEVQQYLQRRQRNLKYEEEEEEEKEKEKEKEKNEDAEEEEKEEDAEEVIRITTTTTTNTTTNTLVTNGSSCSALKLPPSEQTLASLSALTDSKTARWVRRFP